MAQSQGRLQTTSHDGSTTLVVLRAPRIGGTTEYDHEMSKSRECLGSRCSRRPGSQRKVCVYRMLFLFDAETRASSHP
jgi:hypothetical protein